MSSRTARRAKRLTAYQLTTGSWGPSANVPDFGPADGGDAQRTTRVIKDVLPVGKHRVGQDDSGKPVYWDVTPQVLSQIVADYQRMKSNGVQANLGKTHGDENLLIHPDDLIAPIDELKIVGDTLWMASYVTPEEAIYLQNPARKVSVAVVPNHLDGAGRQYKLYLSHVAVTDRPVVAGQQPFMALAETGGGSMNPDLLAAINVLMEAAGLGQLSDVADEAALIEQLKGVAVALGKSTPAEEPAAPEGGEEMPMDIPLPGVPAPMANSIRAAINTALASRDDKIKTLSDELTARKAEAVAKEKAAFAAKCGELQKAGVVKATIDGKIALANKLGTFDLALLDGLAPTLNMRGQSKVLANAGAPNGEPDEATRKTEIAKDIAKRRGITLENALTFVP